MSSGYHKIGTCFRYFWLVGKCKLPYNNNNDNDRNTPLELERGVVRLTSNHETATQKPSTCSIPRTISTSTIFELELPWACAWGDEDENPHSDAPFTIIRVKRDYDPTA